MKTVKKVILAGFLFLGMTSYANADLIITGGLYDGTNVGTLDSYVAQISNSDFTSTYGPGGNPTKELQWINDVTGAGYVGIDKDETVGWYNVEDTTDPLNTNIIAFRLTAGFGHYLIKNASNIRVLIQNNTDYLWGAFDTTIVGGLGSGTPLNLGSDMNISHVSGSGTPTTTVSEPGALSLLALGLVAFGISRRRRNASGNSGMLAS